MVLGANFLSGEGQVVPRAYKRSTAICPIDYERKTFGAGVQTKPWTLLQGHNKFADKRGFGEE
jgi:hypothetical protein